MVSATVAPTDVAMRSFALPFGVLRVSSYKVNGDSCRLSLTPFISTVS